MLKACDRLFRSLELQGGHMKDFEDLAVVVPQNGSTPAQFQEDQELPSYPRDYGLKQRKTERTENTKFSLPIWFDG